MIRCIAVIDEKHGMADEQGIPWQGKLPSETAYYRSKLVGNVILMGYGTYLEHTAPPRGAKQTFVLSRKDTKLRPGFSLTADLEGFLDEHPDVWVIGGAGVFAEVINQADELYISRVQGDFKCTKFFPKFEHDFILVEKSSPHKENGITFHFEIWRRK